MEALSAAVPTPMLRDTISGHVEGLQRRLVALANQTNGDNAELQEQLAEFASLLILQMLQAMRRTVPQSQLLDSGFAHDIYISLLDQEVARHVARREAMGLVPLLQRQINGHSSITGGQTVHALAAYQQQLSHEPNFFSMPVHGMLTSSFGRRQDPLNHQEARHEGIDIAAPAGSLIHAAAPGHVVFNGKEPGYGNLLIIEHQDGYQTYYAHTAENIVTVGAYVGRAQPIARVGETGRATGPHVHFEVRKHGQAVDPVPLLTRGRPPQNGD